MKVLLIILAFGHSEMAIDTHELSSMSECEKSKQAITEMVHDDKHVVHLFSKNKFNFVRVNTKCVEVG